MNVRDARQEQQQQSPGKVNAGRSITVRSYAMRATTADAEARTVEAIMATEAQVLVFDMRRCEVVREVLLMSGVELPESRQLPMLDSHNWWSTRNQFGSTRQIRAEGQQLVGMRHFGGHQDALDAFGLVRDGHLTDGSIGYEVLEAEWIEPNSSREVAGRTWRNDDPDIPLRITTRWRPFEDSVTPIGADEDAKVRTYWRARMHEQQKTDQPTGGDTAQRGPRLGAVINEAIDELADEETSVEDIVDDMAQSAGIEASTIDAIRSGEINCPPIERLEGIADALGIPLDDLLDAAEGDGCTYGDTESDDGEDETRAADDDHHQD